jgi:hypothetical protein
MHFPFLDPNWGADEELLLLEGLEVHGMGNWEDVAEHVTTKTKEECEEHYTKYYLNSPCWPLPVHSHSFSCLSRLFIHSFIHSFIPLLNHSFDNNSSELLSLM